MTQMHDCQTVVEVAMLSVCVCVCVCGPHGYSGSHQISLFFSWRSVWLICSECKIWPKILTLWTPPHSFCRCSMTDLQHNLLILFVGEASSRLICHQQLLNVPQCAEYWWNAWILAVLQNAILEKTETWGICFHFFSPPSCKFIEFEIFLLLHV